MPAANAHAPGSARPRVRVAAARLLLALFALSAWASAQPSLIVNGVSVPGATSSLVSGTAYAPAAALAQALGARFDIDLLSQRLTFTLGARVVQVRTVNDPGAAANMATAITRDGVPLEGPAAVLSGVEPFVPVKATAEALGAGVTFLAASNQVLVVLPRATVSAEREGRGGDERLVLRVSSPTRISAFVNDAAQRLELRIERSNAAPSVPLSGDAFIRADVDQVRGDVDVRVQLAPGRSARWVEVPDGTGFAVIITFPASTLSQAASTPPRGTRVVLDPASDGSERAALTLEAARVVAQRLERSGIDVDLTRSGPTLPAVEERSASGTGARLFVTLQPAQLAPGTLRVYYLGDAADLRALEDAVRVNAEAVVQRPLTDAVRREILLDLVVDLSHGARYAAALVAALRDGGGYQVAPPIAAPVAVLTGAAGRGLLLEVSASDLSDPAFATHLASALVGLLSGDGAAR